jgi:hypothetical protein
MGIYGMEKGVLFKSELVRQVVCTSRNTYVVLRGLNHSTQTQNCNTTVFHNSIVNLFEMTLKMQGGRQAPYMANDYCRCNESRSMLLSKWNHLILWSLIVSHRAKIYVIDRLIGGRLLGTNFLLTFGMGAGSFILHIRCSPGTVVTQLGWLLR